MHAGAYSRNAVCLLHIRSERRMCTPHLIVLHIDHHLMFMRGLRCLLGLRKPAMRLANVNATPNGLCLGRCYISDAGQTRPGLLSGATLALKRMHTRSFAWSKVATYLFPLHGTVKQFGDTHRSQYILHGGQLMPWVRSQLHRTLCIITNSPLPPLPTDRQ